jgi:hypothetical protein
VDLDQDGLADVLSGSLPGELPFFRRKVDGSFAKSEPLRNKKGEAMNFGSASTVFAVDWEFDGDLDLLVGNISGKVYLVTNESGARNLDFGEGVELSTVAAQQFGDSHPVAADWDRDGDLDLLVGHSEGGVLWSRNIGSRSRPELTTLETLIPNSPSPWASDAHRQPNDWGVRAKICVTDWDGDGWPDVLLGDRCGRFSDAPDRTLPDLAKERKALEQLPAVRKQWSASFREYQRLTTSVDAKNDKQVAALLERMRLLKDEIAHCQDVLVEFEPQAQAHGYVWLFQRQPAAEY